MSDSQRRTSITDFVIEALIPLFIIGLIWSLVTFAIMIKGVFYPGQERTLTWVFFLYVMGTVMVNRLAGLYGESEKAGLYSIALASVMGLFALTFCQRFGFVFGGTAAGSGFSANLAIVAVVGIASYKLCRESCFDIKPAEEKSDIQLRSEIRAQQDWYRREQYIEEQEKSKFLKEKSEGTTGAAKIPERLPTRHPGIWTIYFSLFSMIVFSVGQRLLPADSWQSYLRAYSCLLTNLVCALALLLLTTLSRLRFYCWEKKTEAPSGTGLFWTLAGSASILLVVSLASLPPRPVPKYLVRSASSDVETAVMDRKQENKADGDSKSKEEAISGKTWGGQTFQIETALEKEERDRKKMEKEMAGPDEEKKSKDAGAKGGKYGAGEEPDSGASRSRTSQQAGGSRRAGKTTAYAAPARRAPLPTPPLHGLETLGKAAFIILLALGMLFGLGKLFVSLGRSNPFGRVSNRLKELAGRLRNIFKRGRKSRMSLREIEEFLKREDLYLENPFTSGHLLKTMSKVELVNYTYRAFENFAHAHGHTPLCGQTPAEFVKSLPAELQAPEFHALLKMFVPAEYSTHEVPDENIKRLKQIWAKMGT